MAPEYMVGDQRSAACSWPDVLVYQQTPALERDVTLTGPLAAELQVSTTGTDSDWIVKLVDVYPDDFPDPDPNPAGERLGGYQQLSKRRCDPRPVPKSACSTPRTVSARRADGGAVQASGAINQGSFRTGHRIMGGPGPEQLVPPGGL